MVSLHPVFFLQYAEYPETTYPGAVTTSSLEVVQYPQLVRPVPTLNRRPSGNNNRKYILNHDHRLFFLEEPFTGATEIRGFVHPSRTRKPPKTVLSGVGAGGSGKKHQEEQEKSSDSGQTTDVGGQRYAFLLGVVPASLATLYVLGHSPLQILLIGAYLVTVYLANFEGLEAIAKDPADGTILPKDLIELVSDKEGVKDEPAAQSKEKDEFKFLDLLRWLDKSAFAPLLNEKTLEFLFQLSTSLDRLT